MTRACAHAALAALATLATRAHQICSTPDLSGPIQRAMSTAVAKCPQARAAPPPPPP